MNPVRPESSNMLDLLGGKWFYVYVLKSQKDGNFYTGATDNLNRRVDAHGCGLVPSTKYRRPLELIYFEACRCREDAYRREGYLKTSIGKRYLRNRLKGVLQQAVTPQGGLTG